MRYLKIFLLHLQQVAEVRSRVFIYMGMSFFNPLIMYLYWRGVSGTGKDWNISFIMSYYLLIVVASTLIMAHVEEEVARYDIQEGNLASYLLRPFSYFWKKCISEFSWRIFQGALSLFIVTGFIIYTSGGVSNIHIGANIFVILLTFILAYFISFIYKMILGITAFWVTEFYGLFQISEILIFLFAGYIVPLYFYPKQLEILAYLMPFSYMLYFPIAIVLGKVAGIDLLAVLVGQLSWVLILGFLYQVLWKKGIRKFSAIGQ
jgi:ABC-2 type transport system permease protein